MSCEHDMANGTCSICDPYVVQNLRAKLAERDAEIARLNTRLTIALELAKECAAYVPEYFDKKWKLNEQIDAALAASPAPSEKTCSECGGKPWARMICPMCAPSEKTK